MILEGAKFNGSVWQGPKLKKKKQFWNQLVKVHWTTLGFFYPTEVGPIQQLRDAHKGLCLS